LEQNKVYGLRTLLGVRDSDVGEDFIGRINHEHRDSAVCVCNASDY